MAEHFQNTAEALFKGMENFVTTKTVVGEAVYVGDTTILPLVEVSFGMAASARNEKDRCNGGGGMGGKIVPSALLIIKDGTTRLVNIRNQDSVSRLIDMAPDLINRFMPGGGSGTSSEEEHAMKDAAKKEETL